MQFLLLWSGNKLGFRKARIQGKPSKGIIGHWREGNVYVPDATQLRASIPKRYLPAYDRQVNFGGLPQIWADERDNDLPLTIRLYGSRGKLLVLIYLQPLKETI
jgi:hypothetical protein